MLAYIPVRLDLFRTVRRHLHWTLQNLIAFADRTGKCWPSVRTLEKATGTPRSTLSRHLAQLAEEGVITRQRRPGGVYAYTIASRFLPASRGVSHQRDKGVPPARIEEKLGKKTSHFAGFSRSAELPDPADRWQARVRSWIRSGGKFWLADWGPKPSEPGCWVPPDMLQTGS